MWSSAEHEKQWSMVFWNLVSANSISQGPWLVERSARPQDARPCELPTGTWLGAFRCSELLEGARVTQGLRTKVWAEKKDLKGDVAPYASDAVNG